MSCSCSLGGKLMLHLHSHYRDSWAVERTLCACGVRACLLLCSPSVSLASCVANLVTRCVFDNFDNFVPTALFSHPKPGPKGSLTPCPCYPAAQSLRVRTSQSESSDGKCLPRGGPSVQRATERDLAAEDGTSSHCDSTVCGISFHAHSVLFSPT
jgi:hypothetical protein